MREFSRIFSPHSACVDVCNLPRPPQWYKELCRSKVSFPSGKNFGTLFDVYIKM